VEIKKTGDIVGGILSEAVLEEREYDCPKHGKYIGRPKWIKLLKKEGAPLCPKCEEESEKQRAAEEQKRQEESKRIQAEREKADRIKRLTDLNIGERLWNESFETFDAYTDELKHHLEICMEFADNPQGRKLVMLGNNGTGKNHLAASILKVTGGVIYKIYQISSMARQAQSEFREQEFYDKLCKAEMLVIDEIGRTNNSAFETNWFSYVFDKRHENLKPIVLISNKHLKESCPSKGGCPDCFQNWVGNDVLSRIIEDGLVMEFTGEDYRGQKAARKE